jgi:hypothetical protein
MVTFRRADGELVAGEYRWVTDIDGYFHDDDYVELVKETWLLVSAETVKVGVVDRWCHNCDEDVELQEPVDGPVFCDACAAEMEAAQ